MEAKSVFVAVHAGAGCHSKVNESMYKDVCRTACQQAIKLLKERKTAVDAVSAAVAALEDAECTNAGYGSNLTLNGTVECDASLMDGQSLCFGAVGALSGVKNPVRVARKLAEDQKLGHLPGGRVRPSILVGEGARAYSEDCAFQVTDKLVSKSALKTYGRYKRKCQIADGRAPNLKKQRMLCPQYPEVQPVASPEVQDTVGAVCVDCHGNIAAASSSGGIWLKHSGRLGPAAVYGAGCWAQNQTSICKPGVAAVTSGCGEQIIQTLLAKTCCEDVRSDPDFSAALIASFKKHLLESELLTRESEKYGGVLLLKCQSENSEQNVDLGWIHSTASMCVASMDGSKSVPSVIMSRLDSSVQPGHSFTVGGTAALLSNKPPN